MKQILIFIYVLVLSFEVYSQTDEYITIDDAFPTNEYEISEVATMAPEYHKYKKRGVKLLLGGAVTGAVGGILYYYSERFMKGHPRQDQMKISSGVMVLVGSGIMISATIPLHKAKKIKNENRK
jgi:uncharacterized membrane protein YciS (DUF1049 family)